MGQEQMETFSYSNNVKLDSLTFQIQENSFQEDDNLTLLGFDLFESNILSNFGSPLVPLWWKPRYNMNLRIGDLLLQHQVPKDNFGSYYGYSFPFTKIIYSPTYSDGQKLNFIHRRVYKYGSTSINYNRQVSEGFLAHEKNYNTVFKIEGNFYHPKIPFSSKWRIRTYKNTFEWNGGILDDSSFLSESESNWELLPTQWSEQISTTKHIEINGLQEYKIHNNTSLTYELKFSRDSFLYDELEEDSLFYPHRTDSSTQIIRAFNSSNHLIKWIYKINSGLHVFLGGEYQSLKYFSQNTNQWNILGSMTSKRYNNQFKFTLGKGNLFDGNFNIAYYQKANIFDCPNIFKIAYEKNLPNWMNMNTNFMSAVENHIDSSSNSQSIIDKHIQWKINIMDKVKILNTYHNIEGYNYFDEEGRSSTSKEKINVIQSRIDYRLEKYSYHWDGTLGYQYVSNIAIPVPKLMFHQKLYWQGSLFEDASMSQMGVRLIYKSTHQGLSYAPLLGNFHLNRSNLTNSTLRTDLFVNFQIQSIKIFLSYEHFNSLWQGRQYIIKPYPMAKPTFRISLIWNFYD